MATSSAWSLTIAAGNALTLLTDQGATTTRLAKAAVETIANGRRYSGSPGGKPLVATVLDTPCADALTGMARPNTVEVTFDGASYKGCGGDTANLVRGTSWIVAEIENGVPVVERSRVTMEFGTDGRLTGAASCNTYGAQYTFTAESLSVGPATSTRRACSPAFMTQETAFLKALAAMATFSVNGPTARCCSARRRDRASERGRRRRRSRSDRGDQAGRHRPTRSASAGSRVGKRKWKPSDCATRGSTRWPVSSVSVNSP